jgi:hypothetical protein
MGIGTGEQSFIAPRKQSNLPVSRNSDNAHKAMRALTLVGGPAVDVYKVQVKRANAVRQAAVRLVEGEWKGGNTTSISFFDRVFMKVSVCGDQAEGVLKQFPLL